jgi:hypothetical protein
MSLRFSVQSTIHVHRRLITVSLAMYLTACAIEPVQRAPVEFVGEPVFATITMDDPKAFLYNLTPDPRLPVEFQKEFTDQTHSMLGREDRIADHHAEYRPIQCTADSSGIVGDQAIIEEIVRRAASTRVVIVNESHLVTRHRGFSAAVVTRLAREGFNIFAAETFSNPRDATAPVVEGAALTYPRDSDGFYLKEAAFGRLVRAAKRARYRLAEYEENSPKTENDPTATSPRGIARREQGQAENLASILAKAGPEARMVIHVGYSHASEVPFADDAGEVHNWMAARLKALTGIDPFTISQTVCRGGGPLSRLGIPPTEHKDRFDIVVDHPLERFQDGRPVWRLTIGDRAVPIPIGLVPQEGYRIIEARKEGEPVEAVPMDRVAVYAGEKVQLMLPPGRYWLRSVSIKTYQD